MNSLKMSRTTFFPKALFLLLVVLAASLPVFAQAGSGVQTVLILPFSNSSKAPGLEWISEAFPEILGQRLSSNSLYLISREDRLYAFERLGIPSTVHASRATLYRIAEQMDADYVVFGDYTFDGQTFTARAQVLDMKQLHLSPEMQSSGPLINLIEVQSALAWNLLKSMRPQTQGSQEQFVRAFQPIRLDAFENYIRGVVATDRQEKIKRFREAIRLNPQYTLAMLQLGRIYYNNREYESAAQWLARIPVSESVAGEANFLLGMSYYYLGNFDRAAAAFKVTESKIPLTEVYNNLGAAEGRRGRKEASGYFQHAVQADPMDPDYRYNLALALSRSGDLVGATKYLKESVVRHPTDVEARQLLDALMESTPQTAQSATKDFLYRIKRNYDETSYRQLALEVQNALELALSKGDQKTHAAYHVQNGLRLLESGRLVEADKELREAVTRDAQNAEAHVGLARVAEARKDTASARSEARTALRLHPTAEAYILLARLDVKENNLTSAMQEIDQALWLEPQNKAALALKHQIADSQKQTER